MNMATRTTVANEQSTDAGTVPLLKFKVVTLGVEEVVEAESWNTASGCLQLERGGKVVAMYLDWTRFVTEPAC